jgi:hypothetical protein
MCASVQARRAGIDDEGGDAAAAGQAVGLGEHAVEIGHAAVADPGLGAGEPIGRFRMILPPAL